MQTIEVTPNQQSLSGQITVPSSKSHSIRAMIFALMATGESIIKNVLVESPDIQKTIEAIKNFGAKVRIDKNTLFIQGCRGNLVPPKQVIDAGNSGQILRFFGALSALTGQPTIITGDLSIRSLRPVKPLLDGLKDFGAIAKSLNDNGFAPIAVKGPFTKCFAEIEGLDSQPVSALLIAAAFSKEKRVLKVFNPGEKPWVNLTLSWLKRFNIAFTNKDFKYYEVYGQKTISSFSYDVPGDYSSAAFPIVAALITQSELIVKNLDEDDVQGDKALIAVLQKMGALIDYKNKSYHIKKGGNLKGITIDMNPIIDALPILAVLACFCKGETHLINASIAKRKESNRIEKMYHSLRKMGAKVKLLDDGLTIYPSVLIGQTLDSANDHRIAMALSIAALKAKGKTLITNCQCISKSFPNFVLKMKKIGAPYEIRAHRV